MDFSVNTRLVPKLETIALIWAVLILAGCSTTSEQLRANPEEKGAFTVNLPYSTVLPNFYENAQKCFSYGTNGGGYSVPTEAETVPGRSAVVEIVSEGTLSTIVMLSADIKADGGSTKVTYYTSFWVDSRHQMPGELTKWANATWTGCSTPGNVN